MNTSPNTQTKRRFYTKGTPTEAQKEAAKAKRDELKALSKGIKILVKDGKYDTINEGLVELYAENGHKNLNTLHQWNELNMTVKKGEKALLLWGKPVQGKKETPEAKPEPGAETDETDFWPICYVFSEKQVQPSAAK